VNRRKSSAHSLTPAGQVKSFMNLFDFKPLRRRPDAEFGRWRLAAAQISKSFL